MPTHTERRIVPWTPDQMFDLVADVEKYPEFLPWTVGARVRHRGADDAVCDLIIGYKWVRETFTSHVHFNRPKEIDVVYVSGPLKSLQNRWKFSKEAKGGCLIDFHVTFEFTNPMLQRLVILFFNEVVKRMVAAFEARARQVYGDPV